jgi:hypothetical protein
MFMVYFMSVMKVIGIFCGKMFMVHCRLV